MWDRQSASAIAIIEYESILCTCSSSSYLAKTKFVRSTSGTLLSNAKRNGTTYQTGTWSSSKRTTVGLLCGRSAHIASVRKEIDADDHVGDQILKLFLLLIFFWPEIENRMFVFRYTHQFKLIKVCGLVTVSFKVIRNLKKSWWNWCTMCKLFSFVNHIITASNQ